MEKDIIFYKKIFLNEEKNDGLSMHEYNLLFYNFISQKLVDEKSANFFLFKTYKIYFLSLRPSFVDICEKIIIFFIKENSKKILILIDFLLYVNNYEKYFYLLCNYFTENEIMFVIEKLCLKKVLLKKYFLNNEYIHFFDLLKKTNVNIEKKIKCIMIPIIVDNLANVSNFYLIVFKSLSYFANNTEIFCQLFYDLLKYDISIEILKILIQFVNENAKIQHLYLPKLILINKIKKYEKEQLYSLKIELYMSIQKNFYHDRKYFL